MYLNMGNRPVHRVGTYVVAADFMSAAVVFVRTRPAIQSVAADFMSAAMVFA
jgi:hypothetical protein